MNYLYYRSIEMYSFEVAIRFGTLKKAETLRFLPFLFFI